jgi:hypothetical protein
MLVSLFDHHGALNSKPVFAAIRSGLNAIGVNFNSHDMYADVAVIWSMVWAGRMSANQAVWEKYRSTGRPVIVVEVGMLDRERTWKLGINGTGSTAYYGKYNIPDRAKTLGLHLEPWQHTGDKIVIATQRADSEQWAGQPEINQWVSTTIDTIRQYSQRPIVVRPHPRYRINVETNIELPIKVPNTYDQFNFAQSLKSTWAVVNWNSGPGVQAVINGVPAFVGSSSLASSVANLNLSQIESPLRPDRESWLNQIAHTEWTVNEIASGLPLKRLLSD